MFFLSARSASRSTKMPHIDMYQAEKSEEVFGKESCRIADLNHDF
jgi:hypothetical protein